MANKIRKYGTKVNDKESQLILKFLPKLKVEYFGDETDVEITSFDIIKYKGHNHILIGACVKKNMTHKDGKRYKSSAYKSLGFAQREMIKYKITNSIIIQIRMYIKLFAFDTEYTTITVDKLSLQ